MRSVGRPSGAAVLEPTPPRTGLRLLRRALRRNRRRLVVGYPLIAVWHLCETLVPVLIGVVIDRGVAAGDATAFVLWLGALALLFVVLSNGYRYGSRFIIGSIEHEGHRLREEIAAHVLHPQGARTGMLPGETLSLATSDAGLAPVVMRQLGFAISSMLSILAVAVYVLGVDLLLGLLILVGVPGVLLVVQLATPLVARRTSRQQERTAAASGLAGDLVQGLRPLKGIGGEAAALGRYRTVSREARDATVGLGRSRGYLTGMTTGLSGLLLAAVTVVAGSRAVEGSITLGELVALVGLTQFLAEPIAALGELSAQFAGSRASADRIAAFLATPRAVPAGAATPTDPHPQLRLHGVRAPGLHGLDLRTRHGELLAVTVDEPRSADCLVELLAGDRTATAGEMSLGGVALPDLSVEARRAALLVCPHHTEIFEGTLRSAVDPDGTLGAERLADVLAASAADDVLALREEGLESAVRAGGSSLSGGQRQRVALARALASDPPLLVLHEPTSAIDAVTEQQVADGLRRIRGRGDRTTVVLTSSPALLRAADRVLVVRDGQVVLEGTHEDLLSTASGYREQVLR